MSKSERPTLVKPPPLNPNKSRLENLLEIKELQVLGPDLYTNARKSWTPRGARGVYGGSVVAQCLLAGQRTVPADFLPHSCHCYFILAGADSVPILYHVERVRDGRTFATRTVQARQKGKCIFTTTISFAKVQAEKDRVREQVRHAVPLPDLAGTPPADDWQDEPELSRTSPIQSYHMGITKAMDPNTKPYERSARHWMRTRGKVSNEGGTNAHLAALGYMSDHWLLSTIARVHLIWQYRSFTPALLAQQLEGTLRLEAEEWLRVEAGIAEKAEGKEAVTGDLEEVTKLWDGKPNVSMQVSLDHSIYFHEPQRVKADEWMFALCETSWAGYERGLVTQRIFAKDGTLLATCVQEGVVRLDSNGEEKKGKL